MRLPAGVGASLPRQAQRGAGRPDRHRDRGRAAVAPTTWAGPRGGPPASGRERVIVARERQERRLGPGTATRTSTLARAAPLVPARCQAAAGCSPSGHAQAGPQRARARSRAAALPHDRRSRGHRAGVRRARGRGDDAATAGGPMSAGDGGEGWEAWVLRRGSSPAYPAGLEDLGDRAPKVLYGCGDRGLVSDLDPGPRRDDRRRRAAQAPTAWRSPSTSAGCSVAAGITVVSGMARVASTRPRIAERSPATAPRSRSSAAARTSSTRRASGACTVDILTSGGAVISEAPSGRSARAVGLSGAKPDHGRAGAITIVVEAARALRLADHGGLGARPCSALSAPSPGR